MIERYRRPARGPADRVRQVSHLALVERREPAPGVIVVRRDQAPPQIPTVGQPTPWWRRLSGALRGCWYEWAGVPRDRRGWWVGLAAVGLWMALWATRGCAP